MTNSLAFISVVFAIFALMVSPAIMSVSADPDKSNGKGSDNDHPNECGNSNGKAPQKNPNCASDNTGTVDCTYGGDGEITVADLMSAYSLGQSAAETWIHNAEVAAGTTTHSNSIDSSTELTELNQVLFDNYGTICV